MGSIKSVYDSTEELDLVHRAKVGDESAFESLYAAHHAHVVLTISRFIRDADDAEWIANKSLTQVWKHLPAFKEQSKFRTWITRIAINEAQMFLRSEKRRQHDVSLDPLLTGTADSSDASYAQRWIAIRDLELAGIADRQLLERAIGRVPEQFHAILRLRFWDGLSLDEIRKKVSPRGRVSVAFVKSRIHRGRNLLMEQVERMS